jgi:hypothetical protein
MPLHLDTQNLLGKYVLVYAYHLAKEQGMLSGGLFEYLYDTSLPTADYLSREKRQKIKIIALGPGVHQVPWKGITLHIEVVYGVLQVHHDEIIKVINVSMLPVGNDELLIDFVENAKDYVVGLMNAHNHGANKVKKYLYNVEHGGDWEFMHAAPKRGLDSVFLPRDEKNSVLQFINDFKSIDVQKEYSRFNIPYKFNIMLHGVPGAGKSSTISCIASELDSDIAIMSFSSEITDTHLIKAVNRLAQLDNCKVLVMEDIDCLFANRKEHDTAKNAVSLSGLLNVLDGVSRAEGLVVCMTTNDMEALDHAMLRSGRVDVRIKYDYVTREQLADMIAYYFGAVCSGDVVEAFWKQIEFKNVTTSMLQNYFFEIRKTPRDMNIKIRLLFEKQSDARSRKGHYETMYS